MELIPSYAKLGLGGGAILATSSVGTIQAKKSFQNEKFNDKSADKSQQKIGFSFAEIFVTSGNQKGLRVTKSDSYKNLSSNEKEWWEDRFAKMYAERSKNKSYRFGLLIPSTLLKTETSDKETAKAKIKELNKEEDQKYMENFYQECRNLSRFVLSRTSDVNYWEKHVVKFLNKSDTTVDDEEKKGRYFRDAWVACSEEGKDEKVPASWPYYNDIKTKKSNWTGRK
ncbi:hypothetical protein MHSWG343_07440 [Candidatus Mycoplasma haematohominis]|uniref:Uncharacterized protein n=1 Tax=Candidatus Mycoplasma haematohominis TaxID=1494318 RepID=A0A478FRQ2_9MOLU|nr:hypothetical protein MHSWG343_07440 [Candidatus Mycoplasma haemohominis]